MTCSDNGQWSGGMSEEAVRRQWREIGQDGDL